MDNTTNNHTHVTTGISWFGEIEAINDVYNQVEFYKYNGTNNPTQPLMDLRDFGNGFEQNDNWSLMGIDKEMLNITINENN